MNNKEIRWKQRLVNFEKAYKLLERTLAIENPSEAEKGGIVQFYEMCYELSWKLMKDFLESQGLLVKSPREVIKKAFQIDIITNGEQWFNAMEDRNLTSHTYNKETADEVVNKIRNIYFGLLSNVYLFFKRELEK